jgi:hypothetical protein
MKYLVAMSCVVVAGFLLTGTGRSASEGDKKFTIKEVMQKAHSGGKKSLLFRIAAGMGEKKDAEQLLEMYNSLSKSESPKGEAKDWKERTDKMVAAAKDVVAGKDGSGAALQKSVNCAGCHKVHKG